MESVRVVEQAVGSVDDRAYADRIGCDEERDFANRILDQRDAAIRERDTLRASAITQSLTADRFAAAVMEADTLKARVAELEAASGNRPETPVSSTQAASGGGYEGDGVVLECDDCGKRFWLDDTSGGSHRMIEPDNAFGGEVWESYCPACNTQAASGGGAYWLVRWPEGSGRGLDESVCPDESSARQLAETEDGAVVVKLIEDQAASGGGEPVAWMCEWTDHVGLHHTKADAEDEANGDIVPQPLYRSPPQPRGWLTGEERNALETVRIHISNADGLDEATERECKWVSEVCYRLLARSSPPLVVLPENPYHPSGLREGFDHAIRIVRNELINAGVPVKEVG